HHAPWTGKIHHSIRDQRRGFDAAVSTAPDHEAVEFPGKPQSLHVGRIDLRERRKMRFTRSAAVDGPVAGGAAIGRAGGRPCGRYQQTQDDAQSHQEFSPVKRSFSRRLRWSAAAVWWRWTPRRTGRNPGT